MVLNIWKVMNPRLQMDGIFEVEMRKIWLIEARLRKEHSNTVTLNSIQNWGYLP